jgi:hypothetical protein
MTGEARVGAIKSDRRGSSGRLRSSARMPNERGAIRRAGQSDVNPYVETLGIPAVNALASGVIFAHRGEMSRDFSASSSVSMSMSI